VHEKICWKFFGFSVQPQVCGSSDGSTDVQRNCPKWLQ